MRKRFLCVWCEPQYTAGYEEHDIHFFSEDNGFEVEDIEKILSLDNGKLLQLEDLYIIRLN